METVNLETSLGTVKGELHNGLQIFRGIAYAEPLQGLGRVRRPVPVKAWSGVHDALAFGPAAPQEVVPMLDAGPCGDACLTLNVWAPVAIAPLPVMVWIHGGGFIVGSSAQSLYEASHLARDNQVIVVSLNYRLGMLGFGCWDDFPELEADSNNGLRDQILALQWVQDHITAFGGDPARVTIFGESAGGFSVGCLLASPLAKGLFQRAIMQSGSADHVLLREQAKPIAQAFARAAGDLTACLNGDLKGITSAQNACTKEQVARGEHVESVLQYGMTMLPIIGDDVLPEHPLKALQAGASADIPVIVGVNQDEWNLFHYLPQILGAVAMPAEQYPRSMPDRGEQIFAEYRKLMPDARVDDIACAFESDRIFGIPSIRVLEARETASAPSWAYVLDWPSPSMPKLKSCHVMDIPFVFGLTQVPTGMFFTGGGPAAARLSMQMQVAWTSFAQGQVPTAAGWPAWAKYDVKTRATLRIAAETEVVSDPNSERRLIWEGVI